MKRIIVTIFLGTILAAIANSQQVNDTAYRPLIENPPFAGRNYRLLLNIIHWLDGK